MQHKFNPEDLFADSFNFADTDFARVELDTFVHLLSANSSEPSPVLPPPPSYVEAGSPAPTVSLVGDTVAVTNGGMTFDLAFDSTAPASFETGIEQAASILSAAIPD